MEPQARPHRLLIFDRDRSFRGKLQRRIQLLRPDIASETVISISEAEERLGRSDFDAVLVRIDGPDEIEFVLSIRVMAPETPVVALLPGPDSTLESRIRGGGVADRVVHIEANPEFSTGTINRLLETQELLARSRGLVQASRDWRTRMKAIHERKRELTQQAFELTLVRSAEFAPLLAEDDSDQALLLRRAFQELGLPFPLPVARNGEEAIAYLSGTGAFRNRLQHPTPTLVILDVNMPKLGGLEVLAFLRSRPEYSGVPIYLLSGSGNFKDRRAGHPPRHRRLLPEAVQFRRTHGDRQGDRRAMVARAGSRPRVTPIPETRRRRA